MTGSAVEIIQAMLAPGIMISACGLLILGMNNKYSLIVNRIRLLDEEKRKSDTSENEIVKQRIFSIQLQTRLLNKRLKYVRNAVFFYSVAVGLFIASSLSIGMRILYDNETLSDIAILLFLAGMLSVLAGIFQAVSEVLKGYRIVQIELQGEKH